MKPHAFVAMPFGVKPGPDGQLIDFNAVYMEYIRPTLESAGLEAFRADEELRAGDIISDMLQELLIADLVIADLTIDNPNVWYELGIRHALRARGIILVCGNRVTTTFDLYTQRKLRYGLLDGKPDPTTLENDRQHLVDMIKVTMASWHEHKESPVYQLLPNLQEPDWKSLRVGNVKEFWEQHEAWENHVSLACSTRHIGDLLLLADEAPIAAFRAEARIKAGEALRKAGHFSFALEQLERGLVTEPDNLNGLQEKGMCLQRLALVGKPGHSLDRARIHYHAVLKQYPHDAETWALVGRVDKDAWIRKWRRSKRNLEQMLEDAAYEDALLRAAIDSYVRGFKHDPRHYFSGINALTLMHLYRHLTSDARYDYMMRIMAGAVRFAAECETDKSKIFWAKTTLGDLELLDGTLANVKAAYKEAIAHSGGNWFYIDSSYSQLLLLKDLNFRPDMVATGIAIFARVLGELTQPDNYWQPRQVLLFSGHMIDTSIRPKPRFPQSKAEAAAQKIDAVLDQFEAGPEDLALAQGASGGDLLFLEACKQRGVHLQLMLPFPEPNFIRKSILPSEEGEQWKQRYYKLTSDLKLPLRILPDELGPTPKDVSPYERCNLWLLYTALSYGIKRVRFICLWDGKKGNGRGGAAHMYEEVQRRTGQVTWIKTQDLG